MNIRNELVKKIIEGIQDKKGQKIIVADLTEIEDTICNYFVICQGNSPSQVSVITDSIWDSVHKATGDKPLAIDGFRNAQWIAMDYSDVLVHIFLPEVREFYNIELSVSCQLVVAVSYLLYLNIGHAASDEKIDNSRRKLVYEISVVRYRDYRSVKALKCCLKRLAGINIKMVRRLVENEKIHVGQYQL